MQRIRIGFVPIARPTFDLGLARDLTARVFAALVGYTVVGSTELVMDAAAVQSRISELAEARLDMLLLLQASFADSTMALELARSLDAPLLLWALPEAQVGGRLRINSFCGVNLAAHGLRRAGIAYETIAAAPEDPAAHVKLRDFAQAAMVKRRLQGARIGRLGKHPDGFATCLVNRAGLRSRLGVEVPQYDLPPFFQRARATSRERIDDLAESLRERLADFDAHNVDETRGTLGAYLALDELAKDEELDGVAVRCWPEFFTDLGCSACGAMSLLSDAQTPASCEADVNGTITQLILQWLSGEPAFGSDIVAFDLDADAATLWHCGLAPLAMADPAATPSATVHSNRAKPLLMQFPLKPGIVTLARLSEASGGFRLVIGSGEMLKAPMAFGGTSGRIRFDSGAAAVMDKLLGEGLEHHISLTYGEHQGALEMLARMLGLDSLRL
ncbi:MAG: L-fucose/L-arabinose isomerase family protein [Chloroflexi bacterium]|nr:L-fucose/L-arabinose isomerase family protein [Chloroflexota bacterium]MCY4247372.1 L-fucose/L-arabinose isomerase family protein [Chloroflexota bacterium]